MFYKYRKRTLKTRSQTPAPRAYRANKIPVIHNPLSGLHEKSVRHTHTRTHNIHNSHDFTLNGALRKTISQPIISYSMQQNHMFMQRRRRRMKKHEKIQIPIWKRNISHEIYCFLNFSSCMGVFGSFASFIYLLCFCNSYFQLILECRHPYGGAKEKKCEWEMYISSMWFCFCLLFGHFLQLTISMHMHVIARNIFYDVVRRLHFFPFYRRKKHPNECVQRGTNELK